jgi:hypothetical protein
MRHIVTLFRAQQSSGTIEAPMMHSILAAAVYVAMVLTPCAIALFATGHSQEMK